MARRFQLGKNVFDSDIAYKSGPLESGILNMASPETQNNLQQLQFALGIIKKFNLKHYIALILDMTKEDMHLPFCVSSISVIMLLKLLPTLTKNEKWRIHL